MYFARTQCRLCDGKLGNTILDLGKQPPSNDFREPVHGRGGWHCEFPLAIAQCEDCRLVQLNYDVDPTSIFDIDYPLHSSKGSQQWVQHAKDVASTLLAGVAPDSLVLEIGSNDGYLLRNLQGSCKVLGVDPSGISADVPTIRGFFGTKLAQDLPRADYVIAINTVAQIPDLKDFVQALALALKPNGVAILEFPDFARTFGGGQFDQIYHEHYSYLSVRSLQYGLRNFAGMKITQVDRLPTHGGSVRVYVRHGFDAVDPMSVLLHKQREDMVNLNSFAARAEATRKEFRHFITSIDIAGMKLAAYGAAAKGNTFLNYVYQAPWNGPKPIAIGEVNPEKIGLTAPGTNILVVSEDALVNSKPHYILLLAWNWKEEAVKRLRDKGYEGAFLTAVPDLEIFNP